MPVRTIKRVLGGRPIHVEDARDEPALTGPLRWLFHLAHLVLVGIHRSHLTRMAAALSYRTMFGLFPVIVVIAVALAAFTSQQTQQGVVKSLLTYAGLDKIRFDNSSPPPGPAEVEPGSPTIADGGVAGVRPPAPTIAPARLDEWINTKAAEIAGKIKSLPVNLIGLVALGALLYAAMSMLVEIEQAFNDIYNAPEGRSWARRIVQYWTLLTLGPVLLIASFGISHFFSTSAETVAGWGGESLAGTILSVLRFGGAALVSILLLVVIYATGPNTRVQLMPAVLGACVAGVLWEIGKLSFTAYVDFATNPQAATSYGSLYGTLAIFPLFLIWVYVSWLIVLFGLQLAYSMQTYRQATARGLTRSVLATLGLLEDSHPAGRPRLIDPAAILSVLAAVAVRFREGVPSDHNQAAQLTGVDEQAVAEILEKFADRGVLLRVVGGPDRLATYALARPPELIEASHALAVGEEITGPRPTSGLPSTASVLLGNARRQALAGKSIADLIPPATPGEAGSVPGAALQQ